MVPALKTWLGKHSMHQREALANRAGTSMQYIYQLAHGIRNLTVENAARIEQATRRLRRNGSKVQLLTRKDLSPVCRNCPHTK